MYNELKKALLSARKSRDKVTTTLFSTMLGEVDANSKKKGNNKTLDELVLKVADNVLKTNKEMLDNLKETDSRALKAIGENVAVNKFLDEFAPKLLSESEIQKIIDELKPENIKEAMIHFNKNFKGKVDNGVVSKLVKNYLK